MIRTDSSNNQNVNLRKERADKILDTAGDLLLRWGYKRITVDDIAEYAGVGKGTIYLHWKTREDLFNAVLLRESSEVVDELLAEVRKDPETILLHRAVRAQFLAIMRRPIMRAVFTKDLDMLGKMATGGINLALDIQTDEMFVKYLRLLSEHGLVRQDLSPEELYYAWSATTIGFFVIDSFSTQEFPFTLEQRAELLADTLKRVFQAEEGSNQAIVMSIYPQILELLTIISELCHAELRKAYE